MIIDGPHMPLTSSEVLLWTRHSVTKLSQPLSVPHRFMFYQCLCKFSQMMHLTSQREHYMTLSVT